MAVRPWITPLELKAYSDQESVLNRPDEKLVWDITRAELYIINKSNNRFDDDEKYPEVPNEIKLATLLVAEYYANLAGNDKLYKTETFKDYSYTMADDALGDIDIDSLIADHIVDESGVGSGTLRMKLRRL